MLRCKPGKRRLAAEVGDAQRGGNVLSDSGRAHAYPRGCMLKMLKKPTSWGGARTTKSQRRILGSDHQP